MWIKNLKIQLNKYSAFSLIEIKRLWVYKIDLLVDLFTISIRLFLPYSVFWALAEQGSISKSLIPSLMWAILIGQILNRSNNQIDNIVKQEIRTGEIVSQTSLPVNYILAKLAGFLGVFLIKFAFLCLFFTPIMLWIFEININFILVISLSTLAGIVGFLFDFCLGLTSFLIEENRGLFFISYKLYMLFGNQVIPVVLMPVWVLSTFQATPWFLALAAPIEVASGRIELGSTLVFYFLNLILLTTILLWMYKSLQEKMLLLGG